LSSLEAVIQSLIPEGPEGLLSNLSEDKLDETIRLMTAQADPQIDDKKAHDAANYELDAWTKLRMKDLVKERMSGKYRDDAEGFVAAFKDITENSGFDYSRKATPFDNEFDAERVVMDEMWEDRDKMREEVW
jgi:hypothetical protein